MSFLTIFKRFVRPKGQTRDAKDGVIELQKVAEDKDTEIMSLRRSLTDAEAKEAALTKDIEQMRLRLEEIEEHLEKSKKERDDLEERGRSYEGVVAMLKGEIEQARVTHAQTVELLEARTAELAGAQAFLNKADQLPGAEVIAMVEALNSEIMQTAAFLAESFEFEEKSKEGDIDIEEDEEREEYEECYLRATEVVGSRMVELLKSANHKQDPVIVQMAFQSGMSEYSRWMTSCWYFEHPDDEEWLTDIYDGIRESEEQAVAGRWRALTQTHVQRLRDKDPDLRFYFIDAIVSVLITAGIRANPVELTERITTAFAERIDILVKSALQLNKAIGQGITSCELKIICLPPDALFDPATMDDAFGRDLSKGKAAEETILCTTDLGLLRAEKVQGIWEETILIKPKVVLESGLIEIVSEEETREKAL